MKYKLLLIFLFFTAFSKAQHSVNQYQNNLSKRVTFDIKKERVSTVLQKISKAGNFYFAYSGALFQQDSIVNLSVKSLPVRDVLDQLFDGKVDYKENAEYIILRYAVNHFTIEAENITTAENLYLISGYVMDTQTGKRVKNASVYEKNLLQSTLTDDDGSFTLKFKGDHKAIILTASKATYRDTALVFLSSINIKPEAYNDPDKEKASFFSNTVNDLGIGKFLLSARQKIQNSNIPNFLANTPFQASLTPGLSSHGMMSSQVVNKVSLNVLGGYTAGVNGVEVGGFFNLTKGDVKDVQIAGLLNAVGGKVEGVQVAGLHNNLRSDLQGVQVAGLNNYTKGYIKGVQVAGLVNVASKDIRGIQIAGLGNIASRKMDGIQIAGLANIGSKTVEGIQIAGIVNVAKKMKGIQIGLINIADTSALSIGLINIIKNGYHKISFSTNDLINANVAVKTGNASLYTILLAGKNYSDTAKIGTFGLGFGHDMILSNRFSVAAEVTTQYLYLGNWDYVNILNKAQLNFQVKIFNGLSIFGGPVYNYYISDAPKGAGATNYKQQIVPSKHHNINGNKGWFGWHVGITIF